MKNTALTKLLVATLALSVIVTTGCRSKRPDKNITPIPGVAGGLGPEAEGPGGIIGENGTGNTGPGSGIPGSGLPGGQGLSGTPITSVEPITPTPVPPDQRGLGSYDMDAETGMLRDTDAFKANTVYFDFDSSVVGSAEIVKLDEIIQILATDGSLKLKVEGHCDERGTEEYNRSLGERRANSVRDHLMNAGIGADRIGTISFGEDKPADFGHDETAWAQNRRAEFILLRPAN